MKTEKRIGWGVLILRVVIIIGVLALLVGGSKLSTISHSYDKKTNAVKNLEQKYTATGNYEVAHVTFDCDDKVIQKYEIWYPKKLQTGTSRYPVVIMANGTGVPASKYKAVFQHLASWGFIVVGNEDSNSWDGASTSASLAYILKLNDDANSVFYNKVHTESIGVAGHSQGGVGAINAVTNYENGSLYKAIYTASTTQLKLSIALKWPYDVSKINIPYFMTAGDGKWDSETIAPLASLEANFRALPDSVPKVMAIKRNTDHGQMLANADGYMTAWFCYTLLGDLGAAQIFCGEVPEILSNTTNWQDIKIEYMN